jgi:hypothetical protein
VFDTIERRLAFANASFVVLGFAKLDQCARIVKVALQTFEFRYRAVERLALTHDLLGDLRIAPKARVLCLGIERG